MKVVEIGTVLPAGILYLKKTSVMSFYIDFWEDAKSTVASDLTGAVISLAVTPLGGSTVTWNATNSGNRATWTLTSIQTTVTWTEGTFRVLFTKAGDSECLLSGDVRVQA